MSRKPTIYSSIHPYHVTARSNNKDWFDLPLDYCFEIFSNVLSVVVQRYHFEIHSFVLMDNHFHMIISTPMGNISSGMRYFMTETSRGIRDKTKRINHVYGGRYMPCLITSEEYYAACIKYVYRNPVKARIVKKVEDYSWSTISNIPNKMKNLITIPTNGHNVLIPKLYIDKLNWFNVPTSESESQGIYMALRKKQFKLSQQKNTGKLINISLPD